MTLTLAPARQPTGVPACEGRLELCTMPDWIGDGSK